MNAETKLTVADFLAENKPAARRSVYWDYLDEIIELAEAGASGNQICDYIRKTGEQRNVCQPNLFAFIRRQANNSTDSESLRSMIAKIKQGRANPAGSELSATKPAAAGVGSNQQGVTSQTMRKHGANSAPTVRQPAAEPVLSRHEQRMAELEKKSPHLLRAELAKIEKNRDADRRHIFKRLPQEDFDAMYEALLNHDDPSETSARFARSYFADRSPEWFAEFGDKGWVGK